MAALFHRTSYVAIPNGPADGLQSFGPIDCEKKCMYFFSPVIHPFLVLGPVETGFFSLFPCGVWASQLVVLLLILPWSSRHDSASSALESVAYLFICPPAIAWLHMLHSHGIRLYNTLRVHCTVQWRIFQVIWPNVRQVLQSSHTT